MALHSAKANRFLNKENMQANAAERLFALELPDILIL